MVGCGPPSTETSGAEITEGSHGSSTETSAGGARDTTATTGNPISTTAADATSGVATTEPLPDFPPVIFDVGGQNDGSSSGCGGGGSDDLSFSYIWIANSGQGTLSKIDTQTLVEEGRYLVSPSGAGLPSRTSVNLSGDVAVANRTGGITKVYAETEDCQDSNGIPGLQTSTGAADILPWGMEECVAWHTPMVYGSQRPIAWTQGTYDPGSCTWFDQQVWTTGTNAGGSADVMLLNGEDGSIDAMVNVPGLDPFNGFGGYGAVVDSEGNLWFNEMHVFGDLLIRVNISDMSYDLVPTNGRSGYGIAIDPMERIWTCGGSAVNRYDPVADTWVSAALPLLAYGGCMADGEGRLWVSGSNSFPYSVRAFDTETVTEVENFSVPEHLHGISIDFEGNVWGVGGEPGLGAGENAYRIDPSSGNYDVVTGLVDAYTYSDMTGFALVGTTPPPQ